MLINDAYKKYRSDLIKLAQTKVKNLDDAEDIVQDVFAEMLSTRAKEYASEEHLKATLENKTNSRSQNYLRNRKRYKKAICVVAQTVDEETAIFNPIIDIPPNKRWTWYNFANREDDYSENSWP